MLDTLRIPQKFIAILSDVTEDVRAGRLNTLAIWTR